MIEFVSAAILLLYLGRFLAWVSGSKPIAFGDIVFIVPITAVVFLFAR